MKTKMNVLAAVLLLTFTGLFARDAKASYDVGEWTYCAIAYSESTGEYAYSYNHGSRASAETAALERCAPSDAKIVCWARRGFCALALGDEKGCYGTGWSYGDGASSGEAIGYALDNVKEHTTGGHIVLCVLSDGQYVYEK
jgi:hypothetical protein